MFVRQCLDLGSNTPHPVAARLRGAGASVLAGLLALAFAQVASATPFTLAAPVIIDGSNDGGSGVRATIR